MVNSNWSNDTGLEESLWQSNSGFNTGVSLYDDSTISYNDSLIFYDDYDASTSTPEDVNFTGYSADVGTSNSIWTEPA